MKKIRITMEFDERPACPADDLESTRINVYAAFKNAIDMLHSLKIDFCVKNGEPQSVLYKAYFKAMDDEMKLVEECLSNMKIEKIEENEK